MRNARLLAPVGVAAAIAVATAVPHLASASASTPDRAPITAQALLVKASHPQVAGLSGTVEWVANLGLPDLSGLTSGDGQNVSSAGFDPMTLLSGTHDISVWDAGADRQRLALPSSLAEVDLVRNGHDAWTFDNATQKVTHYIAAAGSHDPTSGTDASPSDTGTSTEPAVTPDQAAQRLLDHLSPSTIVTVVSPVYVAGEAAYQLKLEPKATDSTVGSVTVAVDATNGLPLQVQVMPKGSATPALSLGYVHSIDFSVPGAGTFTAPTGATTVTKTIGGPDTSTSTSSTSSPHQGDTGTRSTTTGEGWGTIVTIAGGKALSPSTLHQLDAVSTPVTLPGGGSARLVSTSLLNALVLPNGSIVAGFVTPAALEAAAPAA